MAWKAEWVFLNGLSSYRSKTFAHSAWRPYLAGMRILILDDEAAAVRVLLGQLRSLVPHAELRGTQDSREALSLAETWNPDLLFLDIDMPGMDGFGFLAQARHGLRHVCFVTAHPEYALQAIKEQPIDYLLKPVDPDELAEVLRRIPPRSRERPALRLEVRLQEGIHYQDIRRIDRLEAEAAYTRIHRSDGVPLVSSRNLAYFEAQLKVHGFMRVHKSHLIPLDAVLAWEQREGGIRLACGSLIPLARSRRESFQHRMADYSLGQ